MKKILLAIIALIILTFTVSAIPTYAQTPATTSVHDPGITILEMQAEDAAEAEEDSGIRFGDGITGRIPSAEKQEVYPSQVLDSEETESSFYIATSIIVLVIIALLVFFIKKKGKGQKLTPLAGIAFAFILAGIIFGENRLIGYSLMGVGVVLAIIDMVLKLKKK